MAKTALEKFVNNRDFKDILGKDYILSVMHIEQFDEFNQIIGFTHSRAKTLSRFVQQNYSNWVKKWRELIEYTSNSLVGQCILYGNNIGKKKYEETNKRKTSHFDHSSDTQKRRAQLAKKVLTGNRDHSPRCIEYWMKRGFSKDKAKEKLSEFQKTNTVVNYTKKYGKVEGLAKFNKRKEDWLNAINTEEIGKKRSLGLWRYIERYGKIEGKIKYLAMRRVRNHNPSRCLPKQASKESIRAFADIISKLEIKGISYYLGVGGNSEWFIEDKDNSKFYFYDLVIPSLSLIVEYHGICFHPNPEWTNSEWNNWSQLYTSKQADEVYLNDQRKKAVAQNNGWIVVEVYSDNPSVKLAEAINYI